MAEYTRILTTARQQADARLQEKGLAGSSFQDTPDEAGDSNLLGPSKRGLMASGVPSVALTGKTSIADEVEGDDFLTSYFNRLREQNKTTKAEVQKYFDDNPESIAVEGGEAEFVGGFNLPKNLVGKRGTENVEVASQSYFNSGILDRKYAGNSREAGDVSLEVQQRVIKSIINEGARVGLSDKEIAIALATARHESGFNPDASAKSSSATGIGQFINDTGTAYGIKDANRWDMDTQVDALVNHVYDNAQLARKKGYGDEYIYALHHDGPALDRTGLSKSKELVMPYVSGYLKLIKEFRGN